MVPQEGGCSAEVGRSARACVCVRRRIRDGVRTLSLGPGRGLLGTVCIVRKPAGRPRDCPGSCLWKGPELGHWFLLGMFLWM